MDSVNVELREKGLSGEHTRNRAVWRQLRPQIDRSRKRFGRSFTGLVVI